MESTQQCPACGSPISGWLEGNCPSCLIRLGVRNNPAERDDCPPEDLPRRWGRYELLAEIARGGMGVVYRARQPGLNRLVALKVLIGGTLAGSRLRARFRREAGAAAGLRHPHIVAVHEAGEFEGQPYFSMELIAGRSLAELTRDQPLPGREAARLLRLIAAAVHFAHEQGVLHRDLKPSNILVDDAGIPHITDFGLAKRFDAPPSGGPADPTGETSLVGLTEGDLTQTGQVIGTPNYMPPEQADPRLGPATRASDVYSLGAILYHALTGRAPFMAASVPATLRQVIEDEVMPPRRLNPGVPRDLETICLKCLEKEPLRRYPTARDLEEDLNRVLAGKRVVARPMNAPARLARWCRRRPALAGILSVLALLLLTVAVGSPLAVWRIDRERRQAEAARLEESRMRMRAEMAELETEQQLYAALVGQARGLVRSGEIGQRVLTLDALRRAAAISNSVELRPIALAALALPDLRPGRQLPFDSRVTGRQLDPDFLRFAICRDRGPVEIHAVEGGHLTASLPAAEALTADLMLWSPDGGYLAVKRDRDAGGAEADLEVWHVASIQRVLHARAALTGNALSFHPRHPRLMAGDERGRIRLWNVEHGTVIGEFRLPGPADPASLRFSPDGDRFAVAYETGGEAFVSIHDSISGKPLLTVPRPAYVGVVAWHPGGHLLAIPDFAGTVWLLDVSTGELLELGRHQAQAVEAAFSPSGELLITGGWENELICWDLRGRRRALTLGVNSFRIQFRRDGRQCALRTPQGISLFEFLTRTECRELADPLGRGLWWAAFSPDGRWLAADGDLHLGVWDLAQPGPAARAPGDQTHVPAFSADSDELFAWWEGTLNRWRVQPGPPGGPPQLEPLPVIHSPDLLTVNVLSNHLVLTGRDDTRVIRRNGGDAGIEVRHPAVAGWAYASADERWLGLLRNRASSLRLFRLPNLEPLRVLDLRDEVLSLSFAPDGSELAVVTSAGLRIHETESWRQTRALDLPSVRRSRVLYAQDGRSLWVTSDVRTSGLRDARTLEPLLPLPPGTMPLAVSPDGRQLAVLVGSERLQLWDLSGMRAQLGALGLDWRDGGADQR
ncbi:MAG: protein kinase [Verrucomicrobiae bacterium]|nr:protein kinase [Verrucomicrobiae bacterium]